MEITFEGIIALITLFVGGSGIGGLVTWKWLKTKAKAEADQAVADSPHACRVLVGRQHTRLKSLDGLD